MMIVQHLQLFVTVETKHNIVVIQALLCCHNCKFRVLLFRDYRHRNPVLLLTPEKFVVIALINL